MSRSESCWERLDYFPSSLPKVAAPKSISLVPGNSLPSLWKNSLPSLGCATCCFCPCWKQSWEECEGLGACKGDREVLRVHGQPTGHVCSCAPLHL